MYRFHAKEVRLKKKMVEPFIWIGGYGSNLSKLEGKKDVQSGLACD